jgi:hypothetical protein
MHQTTKAGVSHVAPERMMQRKENSQQGGKHGQSTANPRHGRRRKRLCSATN